MAKKNDFTVILPDKQMQAAFDELKNYSTDKTLDAFGHIGESVVNVARSEKDYKDRTANLKNSIGYIITDGKQYVKEDFKHEKGEVESFENGTKIGLEIAKEANDTKRGEVGLTIVAGMEYSEQLETKEYKVLTFALPTAIKVAKEIGSYIK